MVIGLIAIATVVNDIDRNALAVMWPAISAEITTWIVPIITTASYVPFLGLGAMLVPLAVASVWLFGGTIKPVKDTF